MVIIAAWLTDMNDYVLTWRPGEPSPSNPALIISKLLNAYSRSLPSAHRPMFLAHEAVSMIFPLPTSCSLLMFTSAYVSYASSVEGPIARKGPTKS